VGGAALEVIYDNSLKVKCKSIASALTLLTFGCAFPVGSLVVISDYHHR